MEIWYWALKSYPQTEANQKVLFNCRTFTLELWNFWGTVNFDSWKKGLHVFQGSNQPLMKPPFSWVGTFQRSSNFGGQELCYYGAIWLVPYFTHSPK